MLPNLHLEIPAKQGLDRELPSLTPSMIKYDPNLVRCPLALGLHISKIGFSALISDTETFSEYCSVSRQMDASTSLGNCRPTLSPLLVQPAIRPKITRNFTLFFCALKEQKAGAASL